MIDYDLNDMQVKETVDGSKIPSVLHSSRSKFTDDDMDSIVKLF